MCLRESGRACQALLQRAGSIPEAWALNMVSCGTYTWRFAKEARNCVLSCLNTGTRSTQHSLAAVHLHAFCALTDHGTPQQQVPCYTPVHVQIAHVQTSANKQTITFTHTTRQSHITNT